MRSVLKSCRDSVLERRCAHTNSNSIFLKKKNNFFMQNLKNVSSFAEAFMNAKSSAERGNFSRAPQVEVERKLIR